MFVNGGTIELEISKKGMKASVPDPDNTSAKKLTLNLNKYNKWP